MRYVLQLSFFHLAATFYSLRFIIRQLAHQEMFLSTSIAQYIEQQLFDVHDYLLKNFASHKKVPRSVDSRVRGISGIGKKSNAVTCSSHDTECHLNATHSTSLFYIVKEKIPSRNSSNTTFVCRTLFGIEQYYAKYQIPISFSMALELYRCGFWCV